MYKTRFNTSGTQSLITNTSCHFRTTYHWLGGDRLWCVWMCGCVCVSRIVCTCLHGWKNIILTKSWLLSWSLLVHHTHATNGTPDLYKSWIVRLVFKSDQSTSMNPLQRWSMTMARIWTTADDTSFPHTSQSIKRWYMAMTSRSE